MKAIHTLFAVSLLCSLVSCDINNNTNSLVDEVKEGKAKWLSTERSDYEYTYQALCFCAFTDAMLVVVQDDTVAQVLDIETRKPYTVEQGDEEVPILELFPSLFNTISVFYDRWLVEIPVSHEAEFEWDTNTGMPISIFLDRRKDVADDEITYLFSKLTVN